MDMISDILHSVLGWYVPERASADAHLVDNLHYAVFLISLIGFVGLIGVMIFFIVKYHRLNSKESAYIPHNVFAEALWTVIPTIIFVGIAVWGVIAFYQNERVPSDALEIRVTGKQWLWEFTYKQDNQEASTIDMMYVPINTPVVLNMTSVDVLHSFFIPSFRVKRDTVPGMRTRINFRATKLGDFKVFCTEYCGTKHSKMRATIRVVTQDRYNKWLARLIKEANIDDPVELGARQYTKRGCVSCHSTGSDRLIGPGFAGLWGKKRDFQDGSSIEAANADYIRESILMPSKRIVAGYPNKMNAYAGQLSEKEIDHIIEWIKTLK